MADVTDTRMEAEAVAIVGMSGRFPGADNVQEFWRNLRDGVESITQFRDDELSYAGLDARSLADPALIKVAGILENADLFDAQFFGYSPREAEIIDPQQRVFLECAWHALEDAGYDCDRFDGAVGVYAGEAINTYLFNILTSRSWLDSTNKLQIVSANDKDFLATRVSYKLNLKGPSITIQTGCSTSLVAVHLACQALLGYECDMALAGGVTANGIHKFGQWYQEGGILSLDGHCRAFDANAQGTVVGNGVGIVVLRRLSDALKNNDHIYAVIKGSAINNDGSAKVGYTAPSIDGQAEVIVAAQAIAGIDASTINYVEAHGTATPLGDPIEVAALIKAFRATTEANGFCAIGSVKTNIGHLDAAAGIAGLIKVALSLQNKSLPPSLHFHEPNPNIDFQQSPFYVNMHLREWERNGAPRRAGVSSFGIGGTNAHVIVEEAPMTAPSLYRADTHSLQLLLLSAKTPAALNIMTERLMTHLEQHQHINWTDIAYTSQVGRKHLTCRRALVAGSTRDALDTFGVVNSPRIMASTQVRDNVHVAFMFPGGGAQYMNMGAELYAKEPVFRERIDECAEILRFKLGYDFRQVLYVANELHQATHAELDSMSSTLSTLFATEYALAKLWMSWGLSPDTMIGHSLGEYVAACLAGVISLEDALAIVALRGALFDQLPSSGMLAVALTEDEARAFIAGKPLSLSAVNAPKQSVISGLLDALADAEATLAREQVEYHRLHVSVAAHSHLVASILDTFRDFVNKVELHAPAIPYLSNVTGTWITASQATEPEYWVQHLYHTVRFSDGLHALLTDTNLVVLEVGPGHTLSAFVRLQTEDATQRVVLSSLPSAHEPSGDVAHMLTALGKLWLAGVRVDWLRHRGSTRARRIPLPNYPFERQRYWLEPRHDHDSQDSLHPSTRRTADVAEWTCVPVWHQEPTMDTITSSSLADDCRSWLLFVDECGIGAKIAGRLREKSGERVFTVARGSQFRHCGVRSYELNPERQEDYGLLIEAMLQEGTTPHTIVHLWQVTANESVIPVNAVLGETLYAGYYSLVFLAQALGNHNVTTPLRLWAVSNNMQDLTDDEPLCPAKATILGICKVLPLEYPNITTGSLDISPIEATGLKAQRLLTQILQTINETPPASSLAYRGGRKWVQSFVPLRREQSAKHPHLRERGVYMVTGGLEGVTLLFARHLAQAFHAKLVLINQKPLPEREQWNEWLESHDSSDVVSNWIRQVQELEALGADVMITHVDTTDYEQMRSAVARSQAHFGNINGVIHAADIADSSPVRFQTVDAMRAALAPLVAQAENLVNAFAGLPLDFLAFNSSLYAVTGMPGISNYCAANAFLVAYASYNSTRHGMPIICINWDIHHATSITEHTAQTLLVDANVQVNKGIEALQGILSSQIPPHVIVSTRPLAVVMSEIHDMSKLSPHHSDANTDTLSTHPRPNISTPYVAPSTINEQVIADTWQQVLGIDGIGIHDSFFDLGGHSLMVTTLVSRMRDAFQVEIPLGSIFAGPTVANLAELIEHQQNLQNVQHRGNMQIIAQESKPINALLAEIEDDGQL